MADQVTPGQPPFWQPPPYPQPYQPPYQSPPGGWWQPPYGTGYPVPATPATEPLSIWSLVLGILSFAFVPLFLGIAAIVTGSKAKKAIRNSAGTKSGTGLATGGLALGWLNVVLSVMAGIVITLLVSFLASHENYTSLRQGDCFDQRTAPAFLPTYVTKTSCATPHQQETVGTFEYSAPATQPWPGESGIRTQAVPTCAAMTDRYVARPPPSGLVSVFWYPSRGRWDRGTRRVVCAVRNADGTKRTGSVHVSLGRSTNG